MDNGLRPETITRNSQKCSACRFRKKKCSPNNRDWENSQQKCDFCEAHGLPCGPNLRYSEDPAVVRRRPVLAETTNTVGSLEAREQDFDGSIESSALADSADSARGTREWKDGPSNTSRVGDRRAFFSTLSIRDLEGQTLSILEDFHTLGNVLAYMSHFASVYCQAHGVRQPYHMLTIEERLHELFIQIYGFADEAHVRNEHTITRAILFELVWALDQSPQLYDPRKRHILLKIALIFQKLGHRSHAEHVLLKVANMSMVLVPKLPSAENPFHLLATSFPTSSMAIRCVLRDRWNDTVGGDHFDSNITVPPLHLAVYHQNPNIIVALLSNLNGLISPGSSLNTSLDVARSEVNVEERDAHNRTALFAAVVNGNELCCFALLHYGADANTRDDYGHTALEVAVRKGNLKIVKDLIDHKADVNPDITNCSSLPLHAAIESGNFQFEIIYHLLNSGAQVDLRRYVDNKHAIDLAMDRGYNELAEHMRQLIPSQDPFTFMTHDSCISHIAS